MKKWITRILIAVMVLTMASGCKTAEEEDFSAAVDSSVDFSEPEKEPEQTEEPSEEDEKPSDQPQTPEKEEEKEEEIPEEEEKPEEKPSEESAEEPSETPDEEEPTEEPAVTPEEEVDDGSGAPISVISHNVRTSNDPAPNTHAERLPRFETLLLQKYDADVMGFQEVTDFWKTNLMDTVLSSEYETYTKYRHSKDNEGLTIAWKKSKFKEMGTGMFWMSDTPKLESKFDGSGYYRITTWVKLKDRETNTVFYVFNTHFDLNAAVRMASADLLEEMIHSIAGNHPVIIMGDFNAKADSEECQKMASFMKDVGAMAKDNTGTFHNYGKIAPEKRNRIDYFYVTDHFKLDTYKVMDDPIGGNYAADHLGIYGEFRIQSK